ncbi:hypothetical protein EXN66_Car016937 [Channa argus]|uniref:Uncharacterized protein n=1 Tax=Channa argus TaxID=215402 RepID=A0A6G1QFT1_CHAAH|nr:hypothetical protein EXN66_Car016937 [Channa argus]
MRFIPTYIMLLKKNNILTISLRLNSALTQINDSGAPGVCFGIFHLVTPSQTKTGLVSALA